jgi:hypothetical protein
LGSAHPVAVTARAASAAMTPERGTAPTYHKNET